MIETLKKEWQAQVAVGLFVFLTIFWAVLQFNHFDGMTVFGHSYAKFFGAIYGIIALWGAIWGLFVSAKWGGTRSMMGKAILMLSLGLLAQEFGQIALSYIDYVLNIAGAYPSIGDLGYFGSIPLYVLGIRYLAHAAGVKITPRLFVEKWQAIVLPLVMLGAGYFLFLQGYVFDWSDPVKTFLDFGYPLGQAFYVSLALLTYLLSKGLLGGVMKNKVLFILFALCIQFASDYTFLYQSSKGTWTVGGINDYMYLVAYFAMSLGLLQLLTMAAKLQRGNLEPNP